MPRPSQASQKAKASRKKGFQSQTITQTQASQSTLKTQKCIENIDELVNNCVRYIVYRAGNNLPIRKTDLQKHVLINVGKNFERIIKDVAEVYDYDFYLSDETSNSKMYLVSNALSYKPGSLEINNDENNIPRDVNKILIMLILSHVFMSNSSVSEASLFSFLRSVNIDPDEKHELFGNVREFLMSMVKQRYLTAQMEAVTHKTMYAWGSRADHEISKHELLKFVSKMYKDRIPKSWTEQFESANGQYQLEVERVENGEVEELQDSN